MGSTCSSVKKSSSSSKDAAKSNERKESAESIPYGQTSSECPSSVPGAGAAAASTLTGAKPGVEPPSGITASSQPKPTASSQEPSHAQLGATLSSSSASGAQAAPPQSLSPVPTASSPSPYSTPYSGGNGANQAAAYQSISPTKGHLSLSQYSESVRAASFTQLFHTRNGLSTITPEGQTEEGLTLEDFYVIAVSTESDELVVWSVYEQKPVRTLQSIPRPREVRMVDQLRAVVLCNRELMLYDLDRAALVTKLKGVMNQKMPFYGMHSDRLLVALSRNRMYVNMINLNTGDLETTFKAGEDRFLNSLLTSANGKICVCGDETQKPFPLLVWDLPNRKLLYDLRIPHHEFLTRLSAISDDGHYVVCVCQECNSSSTNFLIVYDLQSGTLFKKWKPECDSVSVAISTRCSGCVINGIENHDVLVWDLSTGNIKYTLSGHTAPADLLQPADKASVFLSYNSNRKDPQLRIWSLEHGTCLWTFTPEKELSCCSLTPNGLAIVLGFVGEKSLRLVVREDADKSAQENESFTRTYLEEMRSKVVPYGDADLVGRVIDLKSS